MMELLSSPALSDWRFYVLFGHLTAGMLSICPWPLPRVWRNRMLVVWALLAIPLGIWLLLNGAPG